MDRTEVYEAVSNARRKMTVCLGLENHLGEGLSEGTDVERPDFESISTADNFWVLLEGIEVQGLWEASEVQDLLEGSEVQNLLEGSEEQGLWEGNEVPGF